ncbi:MAG: AGE family epimerase/isomerase [Candidatus Latescibacteria bacterium]|nr:AGE family epimerase/isomerase [Candidatus Latescibacterota bacterium]
MKRRAFLGSSAGSVAVLSGMAGCANEQNQSAQIEQKKKSVLDDTGKLAGMTLEELREEHRYWLFDDFLPFMDKFVIDHELGGFMCTVDRDGTQLSSNKRTWYEGRGTWVYSYLYNNIEQNPKYIEIAQKSVDYIMKQNPLGKELMPSSYTKEGKPVQDTPDPIFYGDMFVASGFQEFSKIKGNEKYWDMAKQIVLKCVDIYDNRPGYSNLPPSDTRRRGRSQRSSEQETAQEENMPGVERPRIMGHWMVLLNCTQMMLETHSDPEIEAIADRCVDAVMNYHYNPDYGLLNEYLNHDLSRIESDNYGQICVGHGPETLWMVLYDAIRRKDKALFDRAAEFLHRSAEVFWDDVYGGLLAGLNHVDNYIWDVRQKSEWLQNEVLIGLLCVIEHTGAQWAKDWYDKLHSYVMEKFPLKQYGYPLWFAYADRKLTFTEHYNRCEHFHHPRYLMQNQLALDRMIQKKGQISNVFS